MSKSLRSVLSEYAQRIEDALSRMTGECSPGTASRKNTAGLTSPKCPHVSLPVELDGIEKKELTDSSIGGLSAPTASHQNGDGSTLPEPPPESSSITLYSPNGNNNKEDKRARSSVHSVESSPEPDSPLSRTVTLQTTNTCRSSVFDLAFLERMDGQCLGPRPIHPRIEQVVLSPAFEASSVLAVVFNAIIIGVQVDWAIQHLDTNEDVPDGFAVLDIFFTAVFAVELVFRISASGRWFAYWKNRELSWNVFDTVLVLVSILEPMVVVVFGNAINLTGMRLLRLMRLVRMLRMVRLFRFFKQLRIVVQTVTASFRPLIWALILLFVVIYLFSVLMLQLIEDQMVNSEEQSSNRNEIRRLYGGLVRAQYTLFMCIANGMSWTHAADPLLEITPLFGVFFVLYVSFCYFCVVNIVTGIFVENAKQMTEQDDEMMVVEEAANRDQWQKEVKALFKLADVDGSGDLTSDEFEERLKDLKLQVLLKNLGIDVLTVNPKGLFNTLDFNSSGNVTIEEFADGLMRFHGYARSLDLAEVRHFQMKCLTALDEVKSQVKSMYKSHFKEEAKSSKQKQRHKRKEAELETEAEAEAVNATPLRRAASLPADAPLPGQVSIPNTIAA